jgi:hypothetical protein
MSTLRTRQAEGMIRIAVWALAGVSFLTTVAGVLSLAPALDEGPRATVFWGALAVSFGAGLALSIGSLALRLYHRVTAAALLSSLCLASVASLFDTSFYQAEFVPRLAAATHNQIDEEARRKEYDRLAREVAAVVANARREIEPRRSQLQQGEREANQGARYEQDLRPDVRMRSCGPICEEHLRRAARFHAQLEEVERVEALLDRIPVTPRSDSWQDLDQYHADILRAFAQLPSTVALPTAPARPNLLTAGGNAAGVGGIGVVIEMILAGDFKDVKLAVPLTLALISELCPILLVLGGRPWKPCRTWSREKLEHVEDTVDRMPALLPLCLLALKRGLFKDDVARRERRLECNRRRQEHDELQRELSELEDETEARDEIYNRLWSQLRRSASGNGKQQPEAGATPA